MKKNFVLYVLTTLVMSLVFVTLFELHNVTVDMDILGRIYFVTSSIFHSATLMLVPYLLFGVLLALLTKRMPQVAQVVYLVFASLLVVLAIVDQYVFSLYRFHINAFVLDMIFGGNAGQIFAVSSVMVIKVVAIVMSVAILMAGICYLAKKIERRVSVKLCLIVLLAVTLTSQVINTYGSAARSISVVKSREWLPYYFPSSAIRFMAKIGVIDPTQFNKIKEQLLRKRNDQSSSVLDPTQFNKIKEQKGGEVFFYPKHDIECVSPDTLYNIVWIFIDSWHHDTYTEECTPNIAGFAKERARYYANHLSSSNATESGVFSMFTGLSAYYLPDFKLAGKSPLMLDRLQELDYQIQLFPSATLCNPPLNEILFHSLDGVNLEAEGETSYDRDCALTHQFLNYLDSIDTDKPFFSWLFYDLPHSFILPEHVGKPFQPAWEEVDYTKLNNDIDPIPFFNLYRNCVACVDSLVGMVIDKLEYLNMMDNTIIVISGDHGQEFNDNKKNYWGHNGNFTRAQIGVPMLVSEPGKEVDTLTHLTTHYDLCATMLSEHLGVKNPLTDYSMGMLLSDTTDRDYIIVGSHDNFAIIYDGQIHEKRLLGEFESTDSNLNVLPSEEIDYAKINEILMDMRDF